MIGCVLRKPRQ